MTIALAVVAALQAAVIGYGLQKFYQTWSRLWVVVKTIFNLVKIKIEKKEKEVDEKKEKDIRLKVRKSSLKRLANTIINSVAKTCN